jgi:hypothetical protein
MGEKHWTLSIRLMQNAFADHVFETYSLEATSHRVHISDGPVIVESIRKLGASETRTGRCGNRLFRLEPGGEHYCMANSNIPYRSCQFGRSQPHLQVGYVIDSASTNSGNTAVWPLHVLLPLILGFVNPTLPAAMELRGKKQSRC